MANKLYQSLVFLLIYLLITLIMIPKSLSTPNYLANYCPNTTMFANNSEFETKLNTIFHSLLSEASHTSFYRTASSNVTTDDDTIYGLFLCRGDQNTSSCHDCVTAASTIDLPKTYCPNRREAVIWYDECMVRYSNKQIFDKLDNSSPTLVSYSKNNNVTKHVTRFIKVRTSLMKDVITNQASGGGSLKKFASGFVDFTSYQRIYGLGQCTPDLSTYDCKMCLDGAIARFGDTHQGGGRVLRPSCVARYDVHPFIDLSSPPSPSSLPLVASATDSTHPKGNKRVSIKVIIPVVAISAGILAIIICRTKDKILKRLKAAKENANKEFMNVESLQYDLATLQNATNNFSDEHKLGEGGYGEVYKGALSNGQLIAVKKLSMYSNKQGEAQFKNEVLLVAKLQHRNLVKLLGFCFAGQEKLLVYEFVPNKSLDNFLFDSESRQLLDWSIRHKIIRDIARGLLYLHHDSRLRIIHRDLKASNILLDEKMNPKIADFGTARIFGIDQIQGNTSRIVGTYGYMSPEYAMHGQFSVRSDVYSFGVLILEIVCGKRIRFTDQSGCSDDLLSYAWKKWEDNTPFECVDPTIRDSCSIEEVSRCIHLGLLCVQQCVDDRPTMATAVLALDSHTVSLPTPKQPSMVLMKTRSDPSLGEINNGSFHSFGTSTQSVNDVSITIMEGR